MARHIEGRLAGKVCLVTGAAGGLGSAGARRLAEEGALAICADLRGSQFIADAIVAAGGRATASVAAFKAFESPAAYAASKGSVIALARQAAADLESCGIRVNAIAPGMVPAGLPGRVGTPAEIAALNVFPASDESQWITGQTIPIDGGLSAR